jgi:RNA polymerase sigma-70 factor (ECF subfamily)
VAAAATQEHSKRTETDFDRYTHVRALAKAAAPRVAGRTVDRAVGLDGNVGQILNRGMIARNHGDGRHGDRLVMSDDGSNFRPTWLDPATEWLVLRVQDGEPEAADLLVDLWHPRLARYAMRRLGRADAADEVLQEAWLAIVKGLPRLRDPARFPSWAMSIVHRQAALWIRRKRPVVEPADVPDERIGTSIEPEGDEERLRLALARLRPTDRALLGLRYDESMSLPEIAHVTGMPTGSVKRRLHELRRHLRSAMSRPQNTRSPRKKVPYD